MTSRKPATFNMIKTAMQPAISEAQAGIYEWVTTSSGSASIVDALGDYTLSYTQPTKTAIDSWLTRPLKRHAKMEGVEKPYVAKLQAELDRARKLGLAFEAGRVEARMLQEDIRELTRGAGYVEVSDKDLEAMFEFPRLRRKIRWYNLRTGFLNALPAFLHKTYRDAIVLRLKKEAVGSASIPLIEGALYRLAEAKESGIFKSFWVAYPNVVTERQLAREKDPALLGSTEDGSQFLICSWDLPEDIGRVEASMADMMRLKIKA